MVMNRKRHSTSDAIYEMIKTKIVELEYEPNQHLVEETLSTELGVSRTPLRQALFRLEIEGLLVKKTTGRIYVSPISIQEAEEIFLIRELMEGLVARQATININVHIRRETIISRLEDITLLMRNSAETNRQVDVVSYGSEFHQVLQTYSNNKTAVEMLSLLNIRLARYRRLGAYKDPQYTSLVPVHEHEEILNHLKNNDFLAAEESMRNHIRRSLKSTITALSILSL